MNRKLFSAVIGLLVIASMVLAACGPADTATPAVTEPAVTDVPEPVTTRRGGWLDEIVFSVIDAGSAVTQLQAGAIDIYGDNLAADNFDAIEDAGLEYAKANGLFYELTFNPIGPTFPATGKFNPFSNNKIRVAMNWLMDRDYLNQEIYAGGSLAKFLPVTTQFPDYADLADVARRLEAKYAYNPAKAEEVITAEMEAMGATKVDGKWTFNNEPVTLIFIIRTDSDGTRVPLGDYVANQLESIGFAVDRQYKTSSEASPLWIRGNPADGLWHLYTGAWSANSIDRDQGDNLQFYFCPDSSYGFSPLWQAYTPVPELQELSTALAYNQFSNLEERRTALVRAIELSLEDSVRIWLIDGKSFTPYNTNVATSFDLAAGVDGSQIWPYTVRFIDDLGNPVEGGTMKWGQSDLFVDPWNPIAGSNWAFDGAPQRGTQTYGALSDPYTGLTHPFQIESADVTVVTGLPVGKTLDWLSLDFIDHIDVPADTWVDWDAASQTFVAAGDKFPEGTTAQTKVVVTYPADLYSTVKWHDGSNISAADFIMTLIMLLDIGKPESAIYDESRAPNVEAFLTSFKGVRITSTDPLTIEWYSDAYQLDAELIVTNTVFNTTLWPQQGFGEAGWHQIAVSNLADASGEAVYSADKADALQTEWLSYIGGPSLEVLEKYLAQAQTETYIPYAATLGQYITSEEAATRYTNLQNWYAEHGHFWVATGPYYLDKVYLVEKTLTLKHFAEYPYLADKWMNFGEPKFADVEVEGAGQVTIGQEAAFDIFVTNKGNPYPQAEIKSVTVLVYNPQGEIISVLDASAVADGQYNIVVPADVTAQLTAGPAKIEVVVVPLLVSVPTFQTYEFVTVAP